MKHPKDFQTCVSKGIGHPLSHYSGRDLKMQFDKVHLLKGTYQDIRSKKERGEQIK